MRHLRGIRGLAPSSASSRSPSFAARFASARGLEALAVLLIVACAIGLRWVHLGTPGLWWDEIVQVWTARADDLSDVLAEVRRGIPPGAGNAGAAPLDYLLLHLYLRAVPAPAPPFIEIHHRLPSFLYSVASVVLLLAFARRHLDRGVALVAGLLLALSLPHILYAAEARSYSLFVLISIANLFGFAHLLGHRRSPLAWGIYVASGAVLFSSGVFGVFPLLWQFAVLLAVVAFARRSSEPVRGRIRELGCLLLGALGLVVVVTSYFIGTSLGVKHGRAVELDPLRSSAETLLYLGSGSRLLVVALLALPLHWAYARRRGGVSLPILVASQLTLLSLPMIVVLARWKHYYVHPRHALFLLPSIEILSAVGLLSAVRALDPAWRLFSRRGRREAVAVLCSLLLVAAVLAPSIAGFVGQPRRYFARSKGGTDFKPLAADLARRLEGYRPGERYLLIAERDSVANAGLSQYLRWYGLDDRVLFRGTTDAGATLARLREECPGECDVAFGGRFERDLGLGAPVGLTPEFRKLLRLLEPIGTWPSRVRGTGLVDYSRQPRVVGEERDWRPRSYPGFRLLEPAADPAKDSLSK